MICFDRLTPGSNEGPRCYIVFRLGEAGPLLLGPQLLEEDFAEWYGILSRALGCVVCSQMRQHSEAVFLPLVAVQALVFAHMVVLSGDC